VLGSAGVARAKLSLGFADISRNNTYLGYAVLPHVGYTWKSYAYGTNGLFLGTAARLNFGMAVVNFGVDKALNNKRPLKYIEFGLGW
jgi:hypothetical protein